MAIAGPASSSVHPWANDNQLLADAVSAVTAARAFVLDPVTLDLVPQVVAQLPSLANGGLVYDDGGGVTVTLQVRPDARWEDGVPISGSDIAFTVETLRNDPRVPENLRQVYGLIDPESWLVGPKAVRFAMTERTIGYLDLFDPILPRHQMEGTDLVEDWLAEPWVSAGPFRVERVDDAGVALLANEAYWEVDEDGQSLPYLAGLSLEVAGEDGTLGPFDVRPLPVDEEVLEVEGYRIETARGQEWEHLAFQFGSGRLDVNPTSLNASPTFRSTVAALIDRERLVSEFFPDDRSPLDSVVGASWPGAAGAGWPGPAAPPSDLLEQIAAELDASFEVAPSVELVTTDSLDRTQFAGAVLQSLASVGIGVEVSLVDTGLFFRDYVIAGTFDLAEFAWTATPGPVGAVRDLEERFVFGPTRGGFNFYRWGSDGSAGTGEATEAFRALVSGLDDEMDLDLLRSSLQTADDTLAEQTVVVPLYIDLVRSEVADRVVAFIQPAGGLPVTAAASRWRIAEA